MQKNMTVASVRYVNPVLLPLALKRRADVLAAVLRECEREHMTAERMTQWLERSVPVFYDVFPVLDRPYLMALGPDLKRLWRLIGEPKVCLDGVHADWHMDADEHRDDFFSLRFMLIQTQRDNPAPKEIRFQWRDFEQTIAVQGNPWRHKAPEITLMTMQRDNPPQWIRDWCMYHHRVHGVKRILIYNNKARVEQSLTDCVADIDSALEVEFVAWPFPYFIDFHRGGGSAPDLYGIFKVACQAGALTHAYWQMGKCAPYFLNFDIDEYLVNRTQQSLRQLLKQRISRRRPALIVKERPVINRRENIHAAPRACDFRFCIKSFGSVKMWDKTICAALRCRSIIIHAVTPPGLIPPLTWRILAGEESGVAAKIFARAHHAPLFARIVQTIRYAENRWRRRIRRRIRDSLSGAILGQWPDLYINHYRGLTIGWNAQRANNLSSEEENAPVEEDVFMLAKLKEAGIYRAE